MAQSFALPKESVRLSDVSNNLATIQEHPSFTQAFGARLLYILLGIICVLVVAFFLSWLFTRPTLSEVRSTLGDAADAKMVLETLRELQRDHSDQFRSFFQLLVLSGLVPLITLFAGYTFGTREQERRSQNNASGNNS